LLLEKRVFFFPEIWRAVFILIVFAATVIDARTYRIPNLFVILLGSLGFVLLAVYEPSKLLEHGALAAAALAVGYLLFCLIGLGAGDAKFISAILLWLGLSGLSSFLFWFGVCAGILSLTLLAGRRLSAVLKKTLFDWAPFRKGEPVPLALAIGPAAIIASLPSSLV
jgi:prepilin peptidase CpaA